jgi:hypothetical protein
MFGTFKHRVSIEGFESPRRLWADQFSEEWAESLTTLVSPSMSFSTAQAVFVSAEASHDIPCKNAANSRLSLKIFAISSACVVGNASEEMKSEMRGSIAAAAQLTNLQ